MNIRTPVCATRQEPYFVAIDKILLENPLA